MPPFDGLPFPVVSQMAKKKTTKKKTTKKRASEAKRLTPGKVKRGLESAEIMLDRADAEVAPLVAQVEAVGGAAIGAYREPLSGRPILLASLPIEAVQPTPFQRDLSPTHTKRLAQKIEQSGSFLDPLIVVRGRDRKALDTQRPSQVGCGQGARPAPDNCLALTR